jgi:hypothetical protein
VEEAQGKPSPAAALIQASVAERPIALPPAQRRGANAAHGLYTALTPERIEGDLCPQCQMPMGIIRIEQLGLGYDMRTYACVECKREELKVVKRT